MGGLLFDKDGSPYNCAWYAANQGSCGGYDDNGFKANELCCGCFSRDAFGEVVSQGGCNDIGTALNPPNTDGTCTHVCELDWFDKSTRPDNPVCPANDGEEEEDQEEEET